MNIYSPQAVAALIARLRARSDADTKYYRLCIAGWERWLEKLNAERLGREGPEPPA